MPGLHCDDLGHLCLHKQETDTSKFLGCFSILLAAFPSGEGGGGKAGECTFVVSLRGAIMDFGLT